MDTDRHGCFSGSPPGPTNPVDDAIRVHPCSSVVNEVGFPPVRTTAEAAAVQHRLASQVSLEPLKGPIDRVLGADVHVAGDTGYAVLVVVDTATLRPVETVEAEAPVEFPYVSGFLSFREIPPILAAFARLSARPDLVLCDGQGIAHPRGLGLASHLGLVLGIPTIGCAKSRLVGAHGPLPFARGSRVPLVYGGREVGRVVRTRDGVAPLFVSPGHRVDFDGAVEWTLICCGRFRLPEPTRLAHQAARRRSRQAGHPSLDPGPQTGPQDPTPG
ncbi:MAG: deoxyribonuclease V [Acidobacteria bacterium]|nr:deoxyribonuclease V [Acidobacteriota bacterium]